MSEHAEGNAKAWLETIRELVAKLNSDDSEAADKAREEIEQSALSVQVRDGWRTPGKEAGQPEEFEILLTTGGPALRIVGELDSRWEPEPEDARLEWQDWGTPWTRFALEAEDQAALLAFARCFWFGEG